MARSLSLACGAVLLALATAASVGGQSRSMPPPPAALFGTSPSDVSGAEQITDSLSVAGVESGTSTAPQPVQQAFLASVTGNSSIVEGSQTSGFGGFPWTPSARKDPKELPASSESIVESDGTVPQCEVTVQLGTPFNTSDGRVATVLNLIYTNWDAVDVPVPWTTTVMNRAYQQLLDSFNVDVSVAVPRVIQGTVTAGGATLLANGRSSVPITLVVEASPDMDLVPASIFQNGHKCILVNVGGAAFGAAGSASGGSGAEAAETPIRLSGPNIIGVDGNILEFRGVNWFGFDDGVTMLEGMWASGGPLANDLATITQRIRLLGFNAIRLPFSFADLFNLSPKWCVPNCKLPTDAQVLASVTKPSSGRRRLQQASGTCTDVPPSKYFTCAQQKGFGKCNESFMRGYCNQSCGRCNASGCTDVAPSSQHTCVQQLGWGKCNEGFMAGFCNKSCGRCTTPGCVDLPVPGAYTCAQQTGFGKCGEPFMNGYCDITCGRCTTATNGRTAGAATAQPTPAPTAKPTAKPTARPTLKPTKKPTFKLASKPTPKPTPKDPPPSPPPQPPPSPPPLPPPSPPPPSPPPSPPPPPPPSPPPPSPPPPSPPPPSPPPSPPPQPPPGPPPQPPPSSPPPAPPPSPVPDTDALGDTSGAGSCTDVVTPGYTCAQQKSYGKCSADWMLQGSYCAKTCGRCSGSSIGPSPTPAPRPAPTPKPTPAAPAPNTKAAGPISIQLPSPPTGGTPGMCNSYVPSDSTFNRFVYIVQFFARQGFYILLDNQFNFDTTAITNKAAWIQGWTRLAKAVNADSKVSNRIVYDILNEPDAFNVKFEPQNGRPGMRDLYFSAFDAIYAVNPASVLLIEGLGQQNYGNLNWGDGLITDAATIAQKKLSDPNPFFQQLLTKPYRKQVIVAVHVYPPSISKGSGQYTADNGLYQRFTLSHGYLNKKGYCYKGDCQVFPVIYGEFGTGAQDPRDVQWLKDLVPYMTNTGAGADGQHSAITSWFWWAWPQNSGGNLGVVGKNWIDIDWDKIAYLQKLGLVPWYERS